MCLKTMEKIYKGEDKKHAGKFTSNTEDKTFYITFRFDISAVFK